MQKRKLFGIYFFFCLKTSSLIDSLILPVFLIFSLSFFFFAFMNLLFPVFLVSYLPSFLLLSLSLFHSLFYAFIRRFHHLRFYEARDCAQWITSYVGRWRKKSCPCYKLTSTGKCTRTRNVREKISEVGRPIWD